MNSRELLIKTLLLVEDRRFFNHSGIDLVAIVRAFFVNLRERRYAQGGSTITQQLARTLYLHRRKTLLRKLTEVFVAFYLEFKYSKKAILDIYMNEVYMGQTDSGRSLKGFTDAADYHFQAPLEMLTVSEIAALVAMLKGPNIYKVKSAMGVARQASILSSMLESKLIEKNNFLVALARVSERGEEVYYG